MLGWFLDTRNIPELMHFHDYHLSCSDHLQNLWFVTYFRAGIAICNVHPQLFWATSPSRWLTTHSLQVSYSYGGTLKRKYWYSRNSDPILFGPTSRKVFPHMIPVLVRWIIHLDVSQDGPTWFNCFRPGGNIEDEQHRTIVQSVTFSAVTSAIEVTYPLQGQLLHIINYSFVSHYIKTMPRYIPHQKSGSHYSNRIHIGLLSSERMFWL